MMKNQKNSVSSKSLQDLKALLEAKSISLPYCRISIPVQEVELAPEVEETLFQEAMEGVAPISHENCVERILEFRPPERKGVQRDRDPEENEALSRLSRLVKEGKGFEVEDTPEYIEGTAGDVPAGTAKNLHRGKYSIQAHLDLHGLNAQDAREVFEKFLKWAVVTGKRGVLIIHGRGLASPTEPVLKTKVIEWMTHGPWRKWVAAYASARLYDGGTGATYVLLRSRPAAKKAGRK
jgi:DNA-nicking Smr family endonuclease